VSSNHPDAASSRTGTGKSLTAAEAASVDWAGRLNAATAKTLNARAARNQQREEFNEARAHGLNARHSAKLARIPSQNRSGSNVIPLPAIAKASGSKGVRYATAGLFGAPIGRRQMWLVVVTTCPAPRCGGMHSHRVPQASNHDGALVRRCPATGTEYVVVAGTVQGGQA
jgi:hypothetical protein